MRDLRSLGQSLSCVCWKSTVSACLPLQSPAVRATLAFPETNCWPRCESSPRRSCLWRSGRIALLSRTICQTHVWLHSHSRRQAPPATRLSIHCAKSAAPLATCRRSLEHRSGVGNPVDWLPLSDFRLGGGSHRQHSSPVALYVAARLRAFRGLQMALLPASELAGTAQAASDQKVGIPLWLDRHGCRRLLPKSKRATIPHPAEWLFASSKVLFGALLIWEATRHALAINPSARRLDRNDRYHFRSALRTVSSPLARLARRRHSGTAADARSPALALAWRILGRTLEHRLQSTGHEISCSAHCIAPSECAPPRCSSFWCRDLIHDLVDFGSCAWRIRIADAVFSTPRRRRAFRTHTFSPGAVESIAVFAAGCLPCIVTAGPVFWLFHPPFIHNVILPFLKAIGAT